MIQSISVDSFRTWLGKLHSAFVLLAVAALLPAVGRAQNALQNWPNNPPKPLKVDKLLRPPTISICRSGFDAVNTQANLESYLRDRFFPEMINNLSRFPEKTDAKYDPVGKMRSWLYPSGQPADPEVLQTLTQVALEQTKAIINKPDAEVYPPSRIEAVLIMAELNVKEAREQLLAMVLNRNLPDAVRVAALAGLSQQCGKGWVNDPGFSAALVNNMVKLAGAPVPEGPKADFWRWMHGQAADILGQIKWPGKNGNEAPDALLKMVVDERKNPKVPSLLIEQRCQAAKALGQMNYVAGFNPEPCIAGLIVLAHDIRTSPHAEDRRFLRARLGDVVAGLSRLSEIANGDAKNQATTIKDALQADCTALETTKPDKDKIKAMNDASLKMLPK